MENDKGKKERYERFSYQAEQEDNERISDKAIKAVKALRETARAKARLLKSSWVSVSHRRGAWSSLEANQKESLA